MTELLEGIMEFLKGNYEWLFSGVGGAALLGLAGLYLKRRRQPAERPTHRGGAGGNAEVVGDGEARGGQGGSSGPFGPGGKGGDARVVGAGKAVGGAGGSGK